MGNNYQSVECRGKIIKPLSRGQWAAISCCFQRLGARYPCDRSRLRFYSVNDFRALIPFFSCSVLNSKAEQNPACRRGLFYIKNLL
jgi:hypothetical protein